MDELASEQNTTEKTVEVKDDKKEEATLTIGGELSKFIEQILSLLMSTRVSLKAIIEVSKEEEKKYASLSEMTTSYLSPTSTKSVHEKIDFIRRSQEGSKQIRSYTLALQTIPRSYLITLISHYDAFLGRLLKLVFLAKPELLNISEKSLTFAQLIEFASIENAKSIILEKEIEGVLRKSHVEQFTWMETKFNIPLRQGLDIWPDFVELTERRNLFVHTGGIVSSQYLKTCKENGVSLNDLKTGDNIPESAEYFIKAHHIFFELAFKLAHVLWRKFLPDELEKADLNLITVGYEDALSKGNYGLTKTIFNFGTQTLKKWSSEENRLIMVVNSALGYKWSGDEKTAKQIISQEDWSATMSKFRLAEAVIQDQYDVAYDLMREIGRDSNGVNIYHYRTWALFKRIKKETKFLEVFQEIFGEPYEKLDISSLETPEDLDQKSIDAAPED